MEWSQIERDGRTLPIFNVFPASRQSSRGEREKPPMSTFQKLPVDLQHEFVYISCFYISYVHSTTTVESINLRYRIFPLLCFCSIGYSWRTSAWNAEWFSSSLLAITGITTHSVLLIKPNLS